MTYKYTVRLEGKETLRTWVAYDIDEAIAVQTEWLADYQDVPGAIISVDVEEATRDHD